MKDHWPHFSDAFRLFKLNAAWGIYIIIYLCYNLTCTTYRHRGQEPFIYLEEYCMGDTQVVMDNHRSLSPLRPAASVPIVEHTAAFKLQDPQSRPAPAMEVSNTSTAPRRLPTTSSGSNSIRQTLVKLGHLNSVTMVTRQQQQHWEATGSRDYNNYQSHHSPQWNNFRPTSATK